MFLEPWFQTVMCAINGGLCFYCCAIHCRHSSLSTTLKMHLSFLYHIIELFLQPGITFLFLFLNLYLLFLHYPPPTCLFLPRTLLLHTPRVPVPHFPSNHRLPEDLRPFSSHSLHTHTHTQSRFILTQQTQTKTPLLHLVITSNRLTPHPQICLIPTSEHFFTHNKIK